MSFLPLSHVTERTISHFGQIMGGAETWFARSLATVGADLCACRPTLFFAVPRVWEKMRDQIVQGIQGLRSPARAIANRYVGDLDSPHRGHLAAAEHAALDVVVGRTIRRRLGLDQARVLGCGAAPVAPELLRWFHAIGLPVAEGYGSTEVTFSATANRPGATRIGTVGPPMPGVSVRIDPAGEILVRGDTTCAGYWQDEDATARLFDEGGWLHTGDLGHLDDDGYLSVTGRKDDLVITSYGQNVSPEAIEMRLRMDPLVAQAVVIGDGRPFLTALLVLDPATAADRTAAAGARRTGRRWPKIPRSCTSSAASSNGSTATNHTPKRSAGGGCCPARSPSPTVSSPRH